MNSVLNLNTTLTTTNFLNYIEYGFPRIAADLYDLLNDDSKNSLRMMETLATIFKNLCKEIKIEFIEAELDFKEKMRE